MKNCSIGENCTGTINSTAVHYYSVEYSFDPNTVGKLFELLQADQIENAFISLQAIRITTDMIYSPLQAAPILVVVRQIRGILSWTLPYEFPNG
jgi:hypothetical protein